MNTTRISAWALAATGLLLPAVAFAAEAEFAPLTQIPAFQEVVSTNNISGFLNTIYKLCIGVAAVLAVLQIIRAGIMYMSPDSVAEKSEARNLISLSLFGLLLVLSPVIVFGIIDKRILEVGFDVSALNSPQSAPGTTNNGGNASPGTPDDAQTSDSIPFASDCSLPNHALPTATKNSPACEVGYEATYGAKNSCEWECEAIPKKIVKWSANAQTVVWVGWAKVDPNAGLNCPYYYWKFTYSPETNSSTNGALTSREKLEATCAADKGNSDQSKTTSINVHGFSYRIMNPANAVADCLYFAGTGGSEYEVPTTACEAPLSLSERTIPAN